jgi:hypothetical protein
MKANRSSKGLSRFVVTESAKDRCVSRAKPRAQHRWLAPCDGTGATNSDCRGAASPLSPAKLFQLHFKGLSFNAGQALAVKFER